MPEQALVTYNADAAARRIWACFQTHLFDWNYDEPTALSIVEEARRAGRYGELNTAFMRIYSNELGTADRSLFQYLANRMDTWDSEMGRLARAFTGYGYTYEMSIPASSTSTERVPVRLTANYTEQAVIDAKAFYDRIWGVTSNDGLRDFILGILSSTNETTSGPPSGSSTQAGLQRLMNMMLVYDECYARYYVRDDSRHDCGRARSTLFGTQSSFDYAIWYELQRGSAEHPTNSTDLGLITVRDSIYAAMRATRPPAANPADPNPAINPGQVVPPPRADEPPRDNTPGTSMLNSLVLPRPGVPV